MRVAGVDGCRGGWVVATSDGVRVVPRFAEVVALRLDLALVDIPIGLLDGPRACDLEARALLGPRRSSVFPAPPRRWLGSRRYTGQCSVQLWNLLPKIREADEAMTPRLQRCVREAHPECAFALLAGGPLRFSKKTREGLAERRALLEPHFGALLAAAPRPRESGSARHPGAPSSQLGAVRLRGAAPDDVLDACALLWSARRAAAGRARVLGGGERDARGLRCEIVC